MLFLSVIEASKVSLLLLLITTLAACAAFPGASPAVTSSPVPTAKPELPARSDPEVASRLDKYFTDLNFSGSVLIARDGKILLQKGYGEADRRMNIANKPETKFRIASLTKQFTAMAILLLDSQGKLDLNDNLCAYISPCPPAWQAITLQHLLTHSSGIPDYYSSPDWPGYQATPMAPSEIIAHFIDKPLDFQPGKSWLYSNSGYAVLGAIIEQVSGASYESFIKENILVPLNMTDTGYLQRTEGLATGYADVQATLPASFEHPSGLFASGGFYSTVNDLYLWDQALFTDKLISKDLLDEMFTPAISTPDMGLIRELGYGYGWYIGEIKKHRIIFHSGRIEGYTAFNTIYPDDEVIVIILSNQWSNYFHIIPLVDILFGGR